MHARVRRHRKAWRRRAPRMPVPGRQAASCGGAAPIRGLLLQAQRRDLAVETVDLRHSGDTAGSRDDVVGYGAYVFS